MRFPFPSRAALPALAAVALLAAGAAPAAAASRTVRPLALTPGSAYLALGDSVTFGYQEPNVVPAPDYKNAASFVGYPEQIGLEFPHVTIVNAACSGETSASLIKVTAVSNGCENTVGKPGGYRTSFPLHVRYRGSQLAFAVHYLRTHHNVRLVSLMIGANDAFVCRETTSDGCASLNEQHAVVVSVERNIHTILHAIRTTAGYRGQIVIVNYYALSYASVNIEDQSATLNQTQDTAARPFGVEIANGFGLWRTATRIFGGNPCLAGLLTHWNQTSCGIHPSYAGQALLAEAVLHAVRH
jgi:lysophospholipase L1-like esterase